MSTHRQSRLSSTSLTSPQTSQNAPSASDDLRPPARHAQSLQFSRGTPPLIAHGASSRGHNRATSREQRARRSTARAVLDARSSPTIALSPASQRSYAHLMPSVIRRRSPLDVLLLPMQHESGARSGYERGGASGGDTRRDEARGEGERICLIIAVGRKRVLSLSVNTMRVRAQDQELRDTCAGYGQHTVTITRAEKGRDEDEIGNTNIDDDCEICGVV
ncbi:hypothetical protein C8Q74DRAFT_1221355 [Fomes fomentarius]|nr:hypothetical protein C8Q74DRAFT_1221355 [Fomes fomentarius]